MSRAFSSDSTENSDRPSLFFYPFIFAIYLYRLLISPILVAVMGNNCRYYPSCSHYAEDALRRYGVLKGGTMAVKRLVRCHPWHEGGYDPVE